MLGGHPAPKEFSLSFPLKFPLLRPFKDPVFPFFFFEVSDSYLRRISTRHFFLFQGICISGFVSLI